MSTPGENEKVNEVTDLDELTDEEFEDDPEPGADHMPPVSREPKKRGLVGRMMRGFISHVVFAGIAVAAVVGYMYRTQIRSDVRQYVCANPGGVGAALAPAQPAAAKIQTPTGAKTGALDKPETSPGGSGSKPAAVTPPAVTTEKTPVLPVAADKKKPVVKRAEIKVKQAVAQPTAAPTTTPRVDKAPALREAWMAARKKFSAGEPGAIGAYVTLIKAHPDVADLPGELGNIYYMRGQLDKAADQYFETAMRHLKGPQPARAACLIGILERISPQKANQLRGLAQGECPKR